MFIDKDGASLKAGDYVKYLGEKDREETEQYKGKTFKLESEMGTHINIRGLVNTGLLFSVSPLSVVKSNPPDMKKVQVKIDLEKAARDMKAASEKGNEDNG